MSAQENVPRCFPFSFLVKRGGEIDRGEISLSAGGTLLLDPFGSSGALEGVRG